MQFWKEASSTNTFWLVRKIASSLAYLGGNRLAELRQAKQSAISRCAEGYLFKFVPAKQRGHVRESSFLIPRGNAPNGVCFASMMDTYLEILETIGLRSNDPEKNKHRPFLYTGRADTASGTSKFYNSPIGENTLRKIGQDIANWLGLENADKYTGHTFRR